MRKDLGFLFLFLMVFVLGAKAQEDTANGKGWSNMPVVYDTVASGTDAPKIDSSTYKQYIKDSIKTALAKADSMKMGEDEKEFIKTAVKDLCNKNMHGRGYVKDGWDSAAKYILRKFKKYKLKPVVEGGPYAQGFAFDVNTFPGRMELFINGDSVYPGSAYIIDPASSPYVMDSSAPSLRVKRISLGKISDTAEWARKLAGFDSTGANAYYLSDIETMCENLQLRKDQVVGMLPRGVFIMPEEKKLTWGVRREPMAATVFYVKEDSLPKKVKYVRVAVNAVYNTHQRSENIIACMPGEVKDTFIAFTAHYDHLGMMGEKTMFPGASDNASGTAMLLYLANYFSKHKQHYSILFIAFGAEEASLMGSEFYVWHPFVPLRNIKFLTNIDIMGDATNGITVENAPANMPEFTLMQGINNKEKYLPTLYPRENAPNSDHYYFARQHVPCFFIYSNGGPGHYHDIYDVRTSLSLKHIDGVARLLIDFTEQLRDVPFTPWIAPPPAEVPGGSPATQPSATPPPAYGTTPPATQEPSPKPKEEEPSPKPKEEEPSPKPGETPGK